MDSLKCQTATVSPAEPGDFPFLVNPLKHGLVGRVVDWPYSTFHRYVERGIYSSEWASFPHIHSVAGEGGE